MSRDQELRMQTPLNRIRGLGPARSGTTHFWWQRLTSVAAIFLSLFVLYSIVFHIGRDYHDVRAYLGSPFVSVALMLFILAIVFHMYLGWKVIIEDYVQSEGWKILLLMGNIFFSFLIGFACLFAVLKLSFGTFGG
jgi:succinate dehydrogenase / fumarate reductase membrane anchor subunit